MGGWVSQTESNSSFLPSVRDSSVFQQPISLPTVNFLFPCVSGTVPGPMGGQMAAEWLNMGSLHQQEYENPEWAAAAAAEILLHVCAS